MRPGCVFYCNPNRSGHPIRKEVELTEHSVLQLSIENTSREKTAKYVNSGAYLGFHKESKFPLVTFAYTREAKPCFPYFFPIAKTDFFGQRRAMAQCHPLNTPLVINSYSTRVMSTNMIKHSWQLVENNSNGQNKNNLLFSLAYEM